MNKLLHVQMMVDGLNLLEPHMIGTIRKTVKILRLYNPLIINLDRDHFLIYSLRNIYITCKSEQGSSCVPDHKTFFIQNLFLHESHSNYPSPVSPQGFSCTWYAWFLYYCFKILHTPKEFYLYFLFLPEFM